MESKKKIFKVKRYISLEMSSSSGSQHAEVSPPEEGGSVSFALSHILKQRGEFGVSVALVNPSHISSTCPVYDTKIVYQHDGGDAPRVGACEGGGERWHRDVAALYNLARRAGDGSQMPLGSKGSCPPAEWSRAKSLLDHDENEIIEIEVQAQTREVFPLYQQEPQIEYFLDNEWGGGDGEEEGKEKRGGEGEAHRSTSSLLSFLPHFSFPFSIIKQHACHNDTVTQYTCHACSHTCHSCHGCVAHACHSCHRCAPHACHSCHGCSTHSCHSCHYCSAPQNVCKREICERSPLYNVNKPLPREDVMPIFKGSVRSVFKLVITNTQSIATPSPFQQKLVLNYSMFPTNLIRSDWGNVNFQDGKGNYYPSWLESISGSTATIWVKLPNGIPANSSVTIYMVIIDPSQTYDGVNWGAYPLLTSTYGQYDNGANVFNFYDNFAGSTLSSKWIEVTAPPSGVITVNNGVSIINTSNTIYYVSSQSFTAPYIIDQGGILGNYADDGPWFDLESTTSSANNGYLWATRGPSIGNDQLFSDNNGCYPASAVLATASGSSGSPNFTIYTLADVGGCSGTINTYVNYSPWLSGSSTTFPHSGYFSPFRHYNNNTPASVIYWVRVRAYPPNGVMPSVAIYPFFH